MVAEMFPNFYQAHVPDSVKQASDSPALRSAQVRGLEKIDAVAREGLPLGERLAAQEAGRSLSRESGRVQGGITRNLQERGRAGGGTELQARLAGSQQASEQARGFGSDLAQYGVNNRLQAAQDLISGGGAIRGQDVALSGRNADTVNRFNQFISQMKTGANADNARASERSQGYNIGTRQDTANSNVGLRNAFNTRNQEYLNSMTTQSFQDKLARLNGLSGAYSGLAQGQYAEQSARAAAIQGIGQGVGQAGGGLFDFLKEK